MLLRALCSKIPSQIPVTTARNSLWLSSVLGSPHRRTFSSRTVKGDDLNVSHSQFLHGAGPKASWKSGEKSNIEPSEDELEGIEDGIGKILPTRSHLFKLILPLMALKKTANDPSSPSQPSLPLVILLHPSQPLSHVSRLIISFLRTPRKSTPPEISFESTPDPHHKGYEWSDSTDVGDFIRDAARTAEFTISFKYPEEETHAQDDNIKSIRVRVPTFADRTIFMRRRLSIINAQLSSMEKLKADCDREAHRGARRMALSGFGMLVVYWGTVARLTFWDFGWEVMEPITYLSGLSTVICGYLWFLYQGREVSYSSVLDRSISARREAAYIARGLDIDKWLELIAERKTVQKDIARIAEDYDQSAEGGEDEKKPKDTVV